jgi:hypothetical protein
MTSLLRVVGMPPEFSDQELLGYAAEALPQDRMAAVEACLRNEGGLRARLAVLLHSQTSGNLSVADVWRDSRLTCPTRTQWGSYLLHILDDDLHEYFEFHLQVVGCRYCTANVEDLRRTTQAPREADARRQKFFQSSAGYMRRSEGDQAT